MVKVALLEFERDWGNRVDEIKEFPDQKSAEKFCKDFNSRNKKKYVPDWYMIAKIIDD